jgi:hypothetical protein
VEAISFRHARDEADDLIGYDAKDTRTSLLLGSGNVVINAAWKVVVVAIFAGIYELTPLRLDPGDWWVWVLLFFADDFSYYWFHRISHESRFFWASHVVHHSSQHYNLSTALRQTWVPMTPRVRRDVARRPPGVAVPRPPRRALSRAGVGPSRRRERGQPGLARQRGRDRTSGGCTGL